MEAGVLLGVQRPQWFIGGSQNIGLFLVKASPLIFSVFQEPMADLVGVSPEQSLK